MQILIQEATPTLELEDRINFILEVSDAIFPPGISSSVLTTKGDMVVRGASAPQRLAVGADGTSPIADSSVSGGVRWGIPGSVGLGLWNEMPATCTRGSNTTMTFAGTAADALSIRSTVLKWTDSGNTKRAAVVGASESGGTVTVTIAGDVLSGTATMETVQYTRFHRELQVALCAPGTDLETGDSLANFPIPLSMDGWYAVWAYARADGAPVDAAIQIQFSNNDNDMFGASYPLSIDDGENHSKDATTPLQFDSSYIQLTYGNDVDIDVDQVGSTTAGDGVSVALMACPP